MPWRGLAAEREVIYKERRESRHDEGIDICCHFFQFHDNGEEYRSTSKYQGIIIKSSYCLLHTPLNPPPKSDRWLHM